MSGTGAYSKATGNLNVTLSISGFNPRLPNGQCNGNADNSAFKTDTPRAVGRVNLRRRRFLPPSTKGKALEPEGLSLYLHMSESQG